MSNLKNRKYGDGKSIIEILNVGFEPLLTNKEYKIYKEIGDLKHFLYIKKNSLNFIEMKLLYEDDKTYHKWLSLHHEIISKEVDEKKRLLDYKKDLFRKMLNKNIKKTRRVYTDNERTYNNSEQFRNINIFESSLTRCFNCQDMEHSNDIISVVTYYTEIFENIINNGFICYGKKFVFYTAGAGQTRNKKSTFVYEKKLNENYGKLFCGLSREIINDLGGMNTNKFLAYTSLPQTNSSIWEDFDIDRAVVLDDIEFKIPNQKVRYIYTETPEDKKNILDLKNQIDEIVEKLRYLKYLKTTYEKGYRRDKEEVQEEKKLKQRKKELEQDIVDIKSKYHKTSIGIMDVEIPFTDGFGISFKKTPATMVRAPFMKGLFDYVSKNKFIKLCRENGIKINKVTDIYGKEYALKDIDYIFTKSQFKMYKYYKDVLDDKGNVIKTGWEVYKENFKKYECEMCRCNIEKKYIKLNAKTNYQMLQTLTTEMTDEEIKDLAREDIENLNGIGNNVQCMLNVLGVNPDKNDKMNYLQKSLLLYPEMLKDYYIKTLLKNTKDSMIKKFKSGKFNVNGAYIFIIPDTLACMQWWFNGERDLNKLGMIKEGNVYCKLFDNEEEVDCIRSPHLDHAHCLRINQRNKQLDSWYQSKGLYVGVNDIMSKLLMYDNDGDISLVHNNKTIINCAKRFQEKYDMIPNYYDMPKANPELLSNQSLFNGIVLAYHHGNIGTPSNEITKVFARLGLDSTEEEVKQAIEVVALRTCDVNYTIDYAKTLYKPEVPKDVLAKYKEYSKYKVPHFFMYAKGKTKKQVEKPTKCNIDRISDIIPNNRIVFKDLLDKYSYKNLMSEDVDISTDEAIKIVELYRELNDVNIRKLSKIDTSMFDSKEKQKYNLLLEFDAMKQKEMFLKQLGMEEKYIVNVLVKSLQNDINKDLLWKLFGETIYNNLKKNIGNTKICGVCGERFEYDENCKKLPKYCNDCAKEMDRKKAKKRMKEIRKK